MTENCAVEASAAERWGIGRLLAAADIAGYTYEPPVVDGATDALVNQGGGTYVNFASCSFLGMHVEDSVVTEFARSAKIHGLATGGSRMI